MVRRLVISGVALVVIAGGVTLAIASTDTTEDATQPALDCAASGPRNPSSLRTDSFGPRYTVIAVRDGEVPRSSEREFDDYLTRRGAVIGRRLEDGWISIKAGWQRDRRATGRLEVSGKLLNRRGGRFRALINRLYGGARFAKVVPSELRVSSSGCWRFTARAGKARVSYVVQVRTAEAGELERGR